METVRRRLERRDGDDDEQQHGGDHPKAQNGGNAEPVVGPRRHLLDLTPLASREIDTVHGAIGPRMISRGVVVGSMSKKAHDAFLSLTRPQHTAVGGLACAGAGSTVGNLRSAADTDLIRG